MSFMFYCISWPIWKLVEKLLTQRVGWLCFPRKPQCTVDIGLLEYCKYCRIGLKYCRMGSEYSRIELEYCIIDYCRVELEYCRICLEYCSIELDYCRVEEYCRIEREKLEAHQSKVFILSHLTSLQEGTCGQNRTIELYFPRLAHTTTFETSKSQTIFVIPLKVCS